MNPAYDAGMIEIPLERGSGNTLRIMFCDMGVVPIHSTPRWKFKEFIESLAEQGDVSPADTIERNISWLGRDFMALAWNVLDIEDDGPDEPVTDYEQARALLQEHKYYCDLRPGRDLSPIDSMIVTKEAADEQWKRIRDGQEPAD